MVGYYTPYLFIVKVATSERNIIESKAVFLLSLIGKLKLFVNMIFEKKTKHFFFVIKVLVIQLLDFYRDGLQKYRICHHYLSIILA